MLPFSFSIAPCAEGITESLGACDLLDDGTLAIKGDRNQMTTAACTTIQRQGKFTFLQACLALGCTAHNAGTVVIPFGYGFKH